uniref:Tetratricopeptide repeat protein n=1 Tax=uncultured bacterium contig00008 TaxID=1181500 RepID=A0A806KGY3_9BACT|nr:hypothetical protein [uncultured bacterium contig00008]
MLAFSKRLIYAFSNKINALWQKGEESSESKLIVDFAKTKKSPFNIKSESSYNAYLSKDRPGSLVLELKKSNCIAWVDIPQPEYGDHVIEAKIRMDSLGGYSAAGIMFHIADESSYCMALVSSKGYFRIDAVKDNNPKPLIAWTEISDFNGTNINLRIITYGTYQIFIVNEKWAGETSDDTISGGGLGFAAASYQTANEPDADECACIAYLDYFSVDTRTKTIEEQYKKWTDNPNIKAEGRLRLAETFAVMGKPSKALEQIIKAWEQRDEVISSATISYTEVRTRKELLLAARMSFNLGHYSQAEEYFDKILELWPSSAEGKIAHKEMLKVLNEQNKFKEIKEFITKRSNAIEKDLDYYAITARSYWELKEYKKSANAWENAFSINSKNGVYAANAANALELSGNKEKALSLFLAAGKIFLNQGNNDELAVMMPKLSTLGSENWEGRALIGKWAFSIEDYDRCAAEFAASEKLRRALKPKPKEDPALYYLRGLVYNIKGKNNDAIRLLERAVKLAPDYGLFSFKLAEIKLTSGIVDPNLVKELKRALDLIDDDQKAEMAKHAGNLLLKTRYKKNARYFLDIAENAAKSGAAKKQ